MKQEDYLQMLYYMNKMLFKSVFIRFFTNYFTLILALIVPAATLIIFFFTDAFPLRQITMMAEAWLLAIYIILTIFILNSKKYISSVLKRRSGRLKTKSQALRKRMSNCRTPKQVYGICKRIRKCELELSLIQMSETDYTPMHWPGSYLRISLTDNENIIEIAQRLQKIAPRKKLLRRIIKTIFSLLPTLVIVVFVNNFIDIGIEPFIIVVGVAVAMEWSKGNNTTPAAPYLETYWITKCCKEAAEQTYAWMKMPVLGGRIGENLPSWTFAEQVYKSESTRAEEKMQALLQCMVWFGPGHTEYLA
ncbi:MAG: hypothetical protein ACM3PZ_03260 [Bacillota bacterium]